MSRCSIFIFLLVFSAFFGNSCFAQPPKNIEAIEKHCTTVDATKYTVKDFKNEAFTYWPTKRDSYMHASFQGEFVKKIVVELNMGFSTRKYTFYYDSNMLLKAVLHIDSYDSKITAEQQTVKELFHGEYWFVSEFLVSQTERGKWVFENPANERNSVVKVDSNHYKSKALGKS